MTIIPVIHHLDMPTSLSQVSLARELGADGALLISHGGRDRELVEVAIDAKRRNPSFPIGINLLSESFVQACFKAAEGELDMVWADNMGVSSRGVTEDAKAIAIYAQAFPRKQLFASVAFKYQPPEPVLAAAAALAYEHGFIPTTSGIATGVPPDLGKIVAMSRATGGKLAIASGMTPENVGLYAPFVSHVLVSTGISRDEYRIDPERLARFIVSARNANRSKNLESRTTTAPAI